MNIKIIFLKLKLKRNNQVLETLETSFFYRRIFSNEIIALGLVISFIFDFTREI